MAMPVAYLIVMWVFTLDPLGIGEGIGEKLPLLVPAALRAKAEPDDEDAPRATGQDFVALDNEEDDQESFDLDVGGRALKGFEF